MTNPCARHRYGLFLLATISLMGCNVWGCGRTDQSAERTQPQLDPPTPMPENPDVPGVVITAPGGATVEGLPAATKDVVLELKISGTGLIAYRHKIGPAEITPCQEPAGYGIAFPIAEPLRLDLSNFEDGTLRLCIIAQAADGTWQELVAATQGTFLVDRSGPDGMHLQAPVYDATSRMFRLSWSEATESVQHYEFSLAAKRTGCGRPILRYTTTVPKLTLSGDLPEGDYVLCLEASDALGNRRSAPNSGAVSLKQDARLHLAYYRGDMPERRVLLHGVLETDTGVLHERVVASATPSRHLMSRAALQVRPEGEVYLSYPEYLRSLSAPSGARLQLATWPASAPRNAAAASPDKVTLWEKDARSLEQALVLGVGESWHLAYTRRVDGRDEEPGLKLLRSRPGQGVTASALATTIYESLQDAVLIRDDTGTLHALTIEDSTLRYRRLGPVDQADHDHGAPTTHDIVPEFCREATLLNAQAGGGRVHVAFLCTAQSGENTQCLAGAAMITEGSTISSARLGVVDAERACPPFASSRPAIAVDRRGHGTYVFPVFEAAQRSFVYATWYGETSGTPGEPEAPEKWQRLNLTEDGLLGYPQLALDATERLYLTYLTKNGLGVAELDTTQASLSVRTVPVTARTANVVDAPISELSDMSIRGGAGRSHLPFGDWLTPGVRETP